MSSTEIHRSVEVDNPADKTVSEGSKESEKPIQRRYTFSSGALAPRKNKHDNDGRFKFTRKRAQSFTTGSGKFFLPHKRRKKEGIIPPTKFLLGGNIYDPLNLSSLQDEEINRAMNAVTPKSSPLPTPKHRKGEVEVIIPPNINDPLNLIGCEDDAKYEQQLVSPTKKGRKSRNRKKKRNSSSGSAKDLDICPEITTEIHIEDKNDEAGVEILNQTEINQEPVIGNQELNRISELPLKDKDRKARKSSEDLTKDMKSDKRNRKLDLKDKIVSPVIPQPGAWKRQSHNYHTHSSVPVGRFNRCRSVGHKDEIKGQHPQQTPKFKEKNCRFQYGNYIRLCYRNPFQEVDHRLKFFSERSSVFHDKDVLDIGCNIGHVTLSVARDFSARSVVGLDIDRKLIDIARKNLRHYVNYTESPPSEKHGPSSLFFPISMPVLFGDIDIRWISKCESPSVYKKFPHNVTFVQGNYVLETDLMLQSEQPQFDVILCLSLTKWLHLNWGDSGLKRAFRRMYAQLRPGGKLILEAQAWESYKRKKNLTETTYRNYNSIEFLPNKFTQYLLSAEVGFSKGEIIGTTFNHSKGFQRPIQMFTKGEISPSYSTTSHPTTPSHTITSTTTGVSQCPLHTKSPASNTDIEEDSVAPAQLNIKPHASDSRSLHEESLDVSVNTSFGTSRSTTSDMDGYSGMDVNS